MTVIPVIGGTPIGTNRIYDFVSKDVEAVNQQFRVDLL
jgi:hypothetical protein